VTSASSQQPFDQQPLEAAAAISACLAAWRADGDPKWKSDALRAFAWFLGKQRPVSCAGRPGKRQLL